MTQKALNETYEKEFKTAKEIVLDYLAKCELCRNSDYHLVMHINATIKQNPETLTRARRKIQNEEGLFQAMPDIQARRASKELFMRDNITKL